MIVPPDERVRLEEFILGQRDFQYEETFALIGLFTRAKVIVNKEEPVKIVSELVNIPRAEIV